MASIWRAISWSMSRSCALHLKTARTRRTKRGARSFISGSLLQSAEYTSDGFRQSQPAVELGVGDSASFARQRVELGLAVVLRHAPVRLDESFLLHPIERRIQRPFLDP